MSDHTIHSRAMLVALHISSWRARRMDRKATEEFNRDHGADPDAGRYNKLLLPKGAEAYETLISVVNAARSDHYANTLAWSDEGWRLLPSANYMEYTDMMRKHRNTFERALADFCEAYPHLKEMAKISLNGLFKADDYPSVSEIQRKFKFGIDFAPLPAQGDFRLDLPGDEIATLEARVQDRVTKATQEAVADAWGRLQTVVERMHERLSTPGGRFHDTLVENVRDMVDVLGRLNVTGDIDLEAMRARVDRELSIHEPQTLRDNPDVREDTAAKAQSILNAMSEVYGGAR